MQCPKEGCNGEEAAFFQVQIRSADEPMTGFYKVRLYFGSRGQVLMKIVYDLWKSVERELRWDWVDLWL
jgi:transcription initiation factor TFIIS-like protein